MIKAATEIVEKKQNLSSDIVKCGIWVDGTWQRRGYTSMNGCVAAISVDTGKVLDIEVMSSYCPTCKRLQTMPRNFEYESSKADHICECNFTGSSSKIEIVGVSRIFLRSEKNRRLQYTQYYGDGDSKAFMSVKDTYGLNSVIKFDCIGHVQKRVGSRLRKLKTKTKELPGKGKLTDNFIDRLQNYYGIAVRSNVGNLTAMQQNDLEPFLETGSAGRRPGQDRRWETTHNEDSYLVLTARRHRNMNATHLQQQLRSATGTTVSTQTVRNRLHGVGVFSSGGSVAVGIILRSCTKSVRFGGGGVLVYGGISIDGRTYLYIIRDGPLTARRYRDEILRPIVVPYAAAIGDDFILMDDNCRLHRANLVEDFLFEEGIVRMEWPACSSDMNLIEHVWGALGRRVAGRQPPPQTLQKLKELS
ncbi:transposable element Tcb2 transposase [Trichonephila clavipes]|nr:transposable element Tcb2 transposase [Trichonephila clavipes]